MPAKASIAPHIAVHCFPLTKRRDLLLLYVSASAAAGCAQNARCVQQNVNLCCHRALAPAWAAEQDIGTVYIMASHGCKNSEPCFFAHMCSVNYSSSLVKHPQMTCAAASTRRLSMVAAHSVFNDRTQCLCSGLEKEPPSPQAYSPSPHSSVTRL
jgi:hypothetical protein